ncbi:MAG: helix-turn-helix domain-containing protein [Candidatus Dojkabacteria bacterium]|jgi:sugar-specific transcriptional regulator TrmB|nr:helix-turn-helix domain-containing protein [Candidatus Dojkabacteria bacterium]
MDKKKFADATKLLSTFGMSRNESSIYLLLLESGDMTALDISRRTGIVRTTVYRTLEKLQERGLVNEVIKENGRQFSANPYENLNLTLLDREQQLDSLQRNWTETLELFSNLIKEDIPRSKIEYYSGVEGLKQVTWNSSKARGGFRIFEISIMHEFLDYKFSQKFLRELVRNNIIVHQLTNISDYEEDTEVKEFVEKHWKLRYIDPKELPIEFEIVMYNDVYAMYDFTEKEPFCIEIYNERLVEMQSKLFDFVWENAKPMKFIGDQGKAVLADG